MSAITYPLAFGHWQLSGRKLVCRLPRKTITVEAPGALLREVLSLCDGRRAWQDVTAELGKRWAPDSVNGFLSHLREVGALIESAQALTWWTELGQLPGPYPVLAATEELAQLSARTQSGLLPGRGETLARDTAAAHEFINLLVQRESHRTFADTPLSYRQICTIAWAAHGVTHSAETARNPLHRTVASGGNLHSVRWLVFLLRPADAADGAPVTPGLYEVRFHREGGASLELLVTGAATAWNVVRDPRVLQFASALILPLADTRLPARKYGNRATMFAQLEVGESLQNAQLMAGALGAGAIVRGDTNADVVIDIARHALRVEEDESAYWLPLPALVVGSRPTHAQVIQQQHDNWIQVFSASVPRQKHEPGERHEPPSEARRRFAYAARDRLGELSASGRACDAPTALVKAEAEAWERRGWLTLKAGREGSIGDIAGAMVPSAIAAYAPQQYACKGFPFAPFSPDKRYVWIEATDARTGGLARIPAEYVFAARCLPESIRANLLTNVSTSGVAAWTDPQRALQLGVLELIERDAFLRHWIARRSPATMCESTMPADAQHRIRLLRETGARVIVSRLDDAQVPVFTVFVQDIARPFTAITAAAAFDQETALIKALDEAEGRVLHSLAYPAAPLEKACVVHGIADICRYYQTKRYFKRADFYAAGSAVQRFGEGLFNSTWAELETCLTHGGRPILAVDLTPAGATIHQGRTPLQVMRAIVPGLIPIWFHSGLEPAGLADFQSAQRSTKRRPYQPLVIHPFT